MFENQNTPTKQIQCSQKSIKINTGLDTREMKYNHKPFETMQKEISGHTDGGPSGSII